MRRSTQVHKESTTQSRQPPRNRDDKKADMSKTKANSTEESSDNKSDSYDFKNSKDNSEQKTTSSETESTNESSTAAASNSEENSKRNFSEINESNEENATEEEARKKKRKDENTKEKTTPRNANQNKAQCNKQTAGGGSKNSNLNVAKAANVDKKSPCPSPKVSSDVEDETKSDLKVPPLKIVIPQTTNSEQDSTASRSSKNNSQRSQALPYVVPSNSSENSEKDSGTATEDNNSKNEEKKDNNETNASEQAVSGNETTTSATNSTTTAPVSSNVDVHPRKRKMKPNKEIKEPAASAQEVSEPPSDPQVHPHDQPITNCYQLFLDIRKQIEKRRRGLFPVQPKPPQGFKDYLLNRCTYVLAGTTSTSPNISYPPGLPAQMKDFFTEQEKERYRLRMQHVIEKEKLVLAVEQEILRVHGRAARALANQHLPFSVCSILRDEEVYNLITPEQEEKDRNARSRYNGRLFLSWLQDVDDKWEKIKEHMLLRHHNEAESLHAVQKMDWEWKMKELNLCDKKSTPTIDEYHVPMVNVSDDFDLLPA